MIAPASCPHCGTSTDGGRRIIYGWNIDNDLFCIHCGWIGSMSPGINKQNGGNKHGQKRRGALLARVN